MATAERPRLHNALVGQPISEEPAAVDRAVERFEATIQREFGRLGRELELQRAQSIADHNETRAVIAESHLRTVGLILGGLAVATAILAIVIAVT